MKEDIFLFLVRIEHVLIVQKMNLVLILPDTLKWN